MLAQPCYLITPRVVGFRLRGELREGVTATDLVLTITEMLRRYGVVESFVEFFGEGLAHMPLADRATVANMAPEYGATMGSFRWMRRRSCICAAPDGSRRKWIGWRRTPGVRGCSGPAKPRIPTTPTCWSWIFRTSFRAWPGPSAGGPGDARGYEARFPGGPHRPGRAARLRSCRCGPGAHCQGCGRPGTWATGPSSSRRSLPARTPRIRG